MDCRALYVSPMLKDGHAQAGIIILLVAEKEDQSALWANV